MGEENSEIVGTKDTRRWWQKKRWWVGACSFSLYFVPGLALADGEVPDAAMMDSPYLSCDFSGEPSPMVDFFISDDRLDAHLRLPRDYLNYFKVGAVSKRNSVLLKMEIDDFEPLRVFEQQAQRSLPYFEKYGFAGNLDWLIQSYITEDMGNEYSGAFFVGTGILKDLYVDEKTAIQNYPYVPSVIPGLVEPALPKSERKQGFGKDAFAAVINGDDVTDAITCSQVGLAPRSNCSHKFNTEPFSIEVSYFREQLKHWKEIREKAERFIGCILKDYSWKQQELR